MLLEKQPSCLMRVGTDGTLLAVSDAALSMFGVQQLAQVLGTNFVNHLSSETASIWTDFVQRVSSSGSASAECEIKDIAGARRAMMLTGVTLPSHPDGLASLLVNVRDVSTARRLETSLQEEEGRRKTLQVALDDATANVQKLRAQLEELSIEKRQLRAALDTAMAQRQQIASSLDRLAKALSAGMEAASPAQQAPESERPK